MKKYGRITGFHNIALVTVLFVVTFEGYVNRKLSIESTKFTVEYRMMKNIAIKDATGPSTGNETKRFLSKFYEWLISFKMFCIQFLNSCSLFLCLVISSLFRPIEIWNFMEYLSFDRCDCLVQRTQLNRFTVSIVIRNIHSELYHLSIFWCNVLYFRCGHQSCPSRHHLGICQLSKSV